MVRTAALLGVAMIVGAWLSAGEPAPGTSSSEDEQDLVILDLSRPILLRLHLRDGEQAHRARWEQSGAALVLSLDVERDGVLNAKELTRAPSEVQFLRMLQGTDDLEPDPAPEMSEIAGEGT